MRGGAAADKNTGEYQPAPVRGHFYKADDCGPFATLDVFKRCTSTKVKVAVGKNMKIVRYYFIRGQHRTVPYSIVQMVELYSVIAYAIYSW